MLAKKQLKRIIAIGISLALLISSIICVTAEVSLSASATITDANVIFEPSTVQAGSLGWKENGTIEEIINPTGYGDLGNGLFKIAHNGGNQGWLPMYVYDEESGQLAYNKTVTGNFTTAYKVSTGDYAVDKITDFSARLYSGDFAKDDPMVGVVVNYIDNGNFDYVYPYVSGSIFPRTYSVRTVTVTEGGISYKKIYTSQRYNDQIWGDSFVASTEIVGEETLHYIDVNVKYSAEGTVVTFESGDYSYSTTFTDNYFLNYSLTNILDSTDTKLISEFGNNTLSTAKAVGFATRTTSPNGYVDNVSVTFDYNKSATDLANEFRTNHQDILAKSTVTEADQSAIDAALAEYNEIIAAVPAVEAELTTEKAKLDGFVASLAANVVDAYFVLYGDLFEGGFAVSGEEDTILIRKALVAYNGYAGDIQTNINEKAAADYGMTAATVVAHYSALTDAYYFDTKGNLIKDDFNSYTSDSEVLNNWTTNCTYNNSTTPGTDVSLIQNSDGSQDLKPAVDDRGYITSPSKAPNNAPLKQFKVTMKVDVSDNIGDSYPIAYYYDKENDQYAIEKLGDYDGVFWNNYGNSFSDKLNSNGDCWSGLNQFSKGENTTLTFDVTYDYTYYTFDEACVPPGLNTNGQIAYEMTEYLQISRTIYCRETDTSYSIDNFYVVAAEGEHLNEYFTAGIVSQTDSDFIFESVSYTYGKSADEVSAEFEAYADTYGKSTSAVTKDDAAAIDAAIAVYNGLDNTKKAVYANEYNALVALKAVADVHTEIEAITVTPASEKTIAAAADKLAALNVTNATVSASLAAKQAAFDVFRPVMFSATIKKVAEEAQQDLRFKTTFAANDYNANIVSYGMVMVPNLALGENELVIDGSYTYNSNVYNAVNASATLEEGEEMPEEFYGYLSNSASSDNRCGTRIAARAYVVYEIDGVNYTLYSTASRNTDDTTVTKGVRNGVAVRSVYSIARAMATDLIASGTYNETDFITAANADKIADSNEIPGAQVIKFTAANVKYIEKLAQ